MKKLILLLTLTMMFGQTKLETRAFDISLQLEGGIDYEYQMSELFGYEFDYAIIKVVNVSNFYNNQNVIVNFDTPSSSQVNIQLLPDWVYRYPNEIVFDKSSAEIANYGYELNIIASHDINFDLKIAITAEFPIEDTGYIEDGFDYCVEPGANLMSYPCDSNVALLDAIPADALSQFSGIIGQGLASIQLPDGTWVGSLTNMQASSGYWITSNTSLCFNYDCSEN